jgi:multidrug resistance protein MdtO
MTANPEPCGRRAPLVFDYLRLLGPRTGRLAFATRLALICALTTLVVQIFQTPDAALTAYVAFFLNKPDRVESLILEVVFTIVITLTVAVVILLIMAVLDDPLWRVAAMSAFSVGFLFIAFASKLRPLGGIFTLIVGYALDLLGTLHSPELATRASLYVWLFVGIPAGVSVVVNLLLGSPPRRLAERAIAERLRVAAAVLRKPEAPTRYELTECMREGTGEIQAWLKLAGVEKTSPTQDLAALRQAVQSTAAILSWVDVVSRDGAALIPNSMLQQLAQTLEDMARVLFKRRYPIEIALEPDGGESYLPAQSAELWAAMRGLLAGFAEPPRTDSTSTRPATPPPAQPAMQTPAQSAPPPAASGQPPAAPPAGGFFLADAFTNPEYVHYALKTTAAAMFCYVSYSLLDWQAIHTCFITCYIVSLGTAAETVEKLTMRILGCVIGGAAGLAAIVYVLPYLTSIEALLGVVFLGALASAWVAAGSPRISYAGFQMAFAFFLCVIQGPSPAFDLTVARDRIIGILLGNLVVYLLFTRLWPVSMAKRIDPAIAATLRQLSAMTMETNAAARRSLAAQAQGALGAIQQNLDLARYEPPAMRPSNNWLRARRRATCEIGTLQAPLLLGAGHETGFNAIVARRLEDMADSLQPQGRTRIPTGETHRGATPPCETPVGDLNATAVTDIDPTQTQDDRAAPPASADQSPLAQMIRMHLVSLEAIWGLCPYPVPPRAAAPAPESAAERPSSDAAI